MVAPRAFFTFAAVGGLAAMLISPVGLAAQEGPGPFVPRATLASSGPKDPTIARVLGIIPGAGHLYAGEARRGALVAGTFVGLIVVGAAAAVGDCLQSYTEPECDSSVLVDVLIPTAMVGTVVFSIWDAGRAAHRTNSRLHVPARLTLGGSPDGRRYRVGVRIGI